MTIRELFCDVLCPLEDRFLKNNCENSPIIQNKVNELLKLAKINPSTIVKMSYPNPEYMELDVENISNVVVTDKLIEIQETISFEVWHEKYALEAEKKQELLTDHEKWLENKPKEKERFLRIIIDYEDETNE